MVELPPADEGCSIGIQLIQAPPKLIYMSFEHRLCCSRRVEALACESEPASCQALRFASPGCSRSQRFPYKSLNTATMPYGSRLGSRTNTMPLVWYRS
jgi:hypothetical protein